MAVSIPDVAPQPASRVPRSIDSARTSPSVQSTVVSIKNSHIISSLKDNYIYVVVQVTRDLHPVVFTDWLLPECGFDIGVADVTLEQFDALAARLGKNLDTVDNSTDWRHAISGSLISLARLMTVSFPYETIRPASSKFCLDPPY
jgi:CDK inhibitor PHO81